MRPSFTDIHSHFVYGMDDGARTPEDMFAMLDAAYKNGITCLYATPHIVPGMQEFNTARFRKHLLKAHRYCESQGYSIKLFSGAEILYTPQMAWYAENQQLPVLEDTAYVLIEFSPRISVREIRKAVELLLQNGYLPIIAHVERYFCLLRPGALRKLKHDYNVHFQVNASTVVHRLSLFRRFQINRWFSNGLIDFVASDAHNTGSRPFLMREAYKMLSAQYAKKASMKWTGGLGPLS